MHAPAFHKKVIAMLRTVEQSVQLPAAPAALYRMYLDPLEHAAITGSPVVRIAPEQGAEFWAFDGRCEYCFISLFGRGGGR
jgi:hypothetical protein